MSCQSSPTATLFATVTETIQSSSTSFVTETTTVPATTSTSLITTCLTFATGSPSSCLVESTSTSLTTISEQTVTRTEQRVSTVPYTTTRTVPRTTLYAPCRGGGGDTSTTTTSLPGTVTSVVTSTAPASTSYVPGPGLNNGGSTSKHTNIGAIVGGSVGGILGLAAIVIAFMCWRRSKRWDDIFEKDIGHGIGDDDDRANAQLQPAPYQYGMVGQLTPSAASQSTPTSPGLAPQPDHHSRVSSFGTPSAYSRESAIPLTSHMVDPNANYLYTGRPTSYPPAIVPGGIPHQVASPPPERPMSAISSTVSSLTPSMAPGGFYVANASPEDPHPQRPLSDVIPPSKAEYPASLQPASPPLSPHSQSGPSFVNEKQMYQQQAQAQDPSNAGPSSAPAAPPVVQAPGQFGSVHQEVELMEAPPAYRQ